MDSPPREDALDAPPTQITADQGYSSHSKPSTSMHIFSSHFNSRPKNSSLRLRNPNFATPRILNPTNPTSNHHPPNSNTASFHISTPNPHPSPVHLTSSFPSNPSPSLSRPINYLPTGPTLSSTSTSLNRRNSHLSTSSPRCRHNRIPPQLLRSTARIRPSKISSPSSPHQIQGL